MCNLWHNWTVLTGLPWEGHEEMEVETERRDKGQRRKKTKGRLKVKEDDESIKESIETREEINQARHKMAVTLLLGDNRSSLSFQKCVCMLARFQFL